MLPGGVYFAETNKKYSTPFAVKRILSGILSILNALLHLAGHKEDFVGNTSFLW